MSTSTPTAAELYETYQKTVAAPRAAAEKAAEEKASTTVANAEASPAEAAKRALTVSSALMRVHTCSNFDCDIMRLRPWLPAKVYPQHAPIGQKKDSKVPRRIAVHEGWPYAGIEMLVAGQLTLSEFISPPRVTVAKTERERYISVKGYPHEWLVGGEGTPNNAGLAPYLCHGCMCPSVIALTCTLEEATLPAKVLLSSGPIDARDPRCLRPLGLQFRLPIERSLPLFARLLARDAGFLAGPPPPEAAQQMATAAIEAAVAAAGAGLPIEAAKAAEEVAMRKATESVAKVAAAAAASAQQAVEAVPARLNEFIAAVAPAEEHSTPAEVDGALLHGRLIAHVTHPYMSKEVPIAGLVSRWPEQVPSEKLPASSLRQSLAPLNTSMRHPPMKMPHEGERAQGGAGAVGGAGEKGALADKNGATAVVAVEAGKVEPAEAGADREEVFQIVPTARPAQVKAKRKELLAMHGEALRTRRQVVGLRLQNEWHLERARLLRQLCAQLQRGCTLLGERQRDRRVRPAPKGSADGKPEHFPSLSENELRAIAAAYLVEEQLLLPAEEGRRIVREEQLLTPADEAAWMAKLPSDVMVLLRHVAKAAAEGGLDLSKKEWRPRPSSFFSSSGPPPPTGDPEGGAQASWMTFKLPEGSAWSALPLPTEEPRK